MPENTQQIKAARQLMSDKKHKEAERILNELIKTDAGNSVLYRLRGRCYQMLANQFDKRRPQHAKRLYNAANLDYEKCLELDVMDDKALSYQDELEESMQALPQASSSSASPLQKSLQLPAAGRHAAPSVVSGSFKTMPDTDSESVLSKEEEKLIDTIDLEHNFDKNNPTLVAKFIQKSIESILELKNVRSSRCD